MLIFDVLYIFVVMKITMMAMYTNLYKNICIYIYVDNKHNSLCCYCWWRSYWPLYYCRLWVIRISYCCHRNDWLECCNYHIDFVCVGIHTRFNGPETTMGHIVFTRLYNIYAWYTYTHTLVYLSIRMAHSHSWLHRSIVVSMSLKFYAYVLS